MSGAPPVDRAAEPRIPTDEIRERAYDLWDRNHRPDGYDLQFWFMAERALRAERRAKVEPGTGSDARDSLRGADDLKRPLL